MANLIDILINAKWTGGAAVTKAGGDLQKLGNNAAMSSVEMAAVQAKSRLLGTALSGLGEQVALGNLTTKQATEAYKQYAATLADVGVAAPKAGLNIAGLTSTVFALTAAITAAVVSAKKLGEAIVEGAELEATTIRFDRLAESIGTTGDALRQDLGIATRGLVSDMQAMASATDFLALGLADTHDEAVRLTNVASQLGFNMNQLVLTLTNQTTMRFDALGVSVAGFEDKVKALEDAGYSASEAFTEAFLQQAEQQIVRVGSRAETTAGQIDILTASWQNLTDEIKRSAAESASPLLEQLTAGIRAANDAAQATQQIRESGGDLATQRIAIETLAGAIEILDGANRDLAIGLTANRESVRQSLADIAAAAVGTGKTLTEQKQILGDLGIVLDETGLHFGDFGTTLDQFNDALERVELQDFEDGLAAVDRKLTDLIDHTIELNKEYTGQQIPLDELYAFADGLEITNEQAKELAITLGGTGNALEFLEKLASDPSSFLGGLKDVFSGSGLGAIGEIVTLRAEQWTDFQGDLTDISEREGELRAETEEQFEKRRTDTVNQYGARRAQDEADWQRQIARQDVQLQRSIDKTREDSADRQIEFRERANERLADLERDHLARMKDIIDNADLQLIQAAGKLDAASVVAIQQQRDRALKDEEESYKESQEQIERQLARQIAAEKEAAEERIRDLEEANAERRRIEEEDRAIRLQREQEAHDARMLEYDRQEQERLDQIREQGIEDRTERADQYEKYWTDREGIETTKMTAILQAESDWWDERLGLVPSSNGPQGFNPTGAMFPVQAGGTSVGDITVNVTGGDSPAATGEAVGKALLDLFGRF
jgi:hypothetical protein